MHIGIIIMSFRKNYKAHYYAEFLKNFHVIMKARNYM